MRNKLCIIWMHIWIFRVFYYINFIPIQSCTIFISFYFYFLTCLFTERKFQKFSDKTIRKLTNKYSKSLQNGILNITSLLFTNLSQRHVWEKLFSSKASTLRKLCERCGNNVEAMCKLLLRKFVLILSTRNLMIAANFHELFTSFWI